MNLILEVIKSLISGLNNRIQHIASTLGKRVDTVQAGTKEALTSAKEALTTAKKAQKIAEQATIPICYANVKYDDYSISIDNFEYIQGQLLVLIPTGECNYTSANLKINNEVSYRFALLGANEAYTTDLPNREFLKAYMPVLVCLSTKDNDNLAIIVSHFPSTENLIGICNSKADETIKIVSFDIDLPIRSGTIMFIKFTNGNIADKPIIPIKIDANTSTYCSILDRNGNIISADAIKSGYLHQFIYSRNGIVLLD